MTAAALSRLLPGEGSVYLAESETIVVGIGEPTLPHIRAINERPGNDEADSMARTRATFKLGIEFRGWNRIGDNSIPPFGTFGRGTGGVDFRHDWVRVLCERAPFALLDAVSYAGALARAGKFDRPASDPHRLAGTFGHADQFDARLLARYLREIAEDMGDRRPEGVELASSATGIAATAPRSALRAGSSNRLPFHEEEMCASASWAAVLIGRGGLPRRIDPPVAAVPAAAAHAAMARLTAEIAAALPNNPRNAADRAAQTRHLIP